MAQRSHGDLEVRRRVAEEAARLIGDQGMRDFEVALRKAAEHLGVRDHGAMPRRAEIEAALQERQRLFQPATQPRALALRRAAALEAMDFFARFEPRLVGAVLEGYADELSAVCLHLFCDDADEVLRFLDERGIRYEQEQRRVRYPDRSLAVLPALRFEADGMPFDLTVFASADLRRAPLERGGDRPMRRAGRAAVAALPEPGEPGSGG
jgi:hypothetical protein